MTGERIVTTTEDPLMIFAVTAPVNVNTVYDDVEDATPETAVPLLTEMVAPLFEVVNESGRETIIFDPAMIGSVAGRESEIVEYDLPVVAVADDVDPVLNTAPENELSVDAYVVKDEPSMPAVVVPDSDSVPLV